MTTTSYPIDKSLFLISQTVTTKRETFVEVPTNHLVVVDCSGSMSSDLPKIREQLKKKLPKLLKDGDTFSMIWFSGRGDFGTLIECEPVATLGDLNDINKAIDRWLRPVGLTGFKEPLVEAKKLIEKISKKNKNTFSLFFMSDGCDNQWDRSEIIKAVEALDGKLSATTFVEYGYYADRPLLAAMAAKCGGSLIFAESFDKYEPIFNARMQCRPVGAKRVEVKIEGDPIGGFVFALDSKEREITTYEVTSGKALVGEHVSAIWYLSPSSAGADDSWVAGLAPMGQPGSSEGSTTKSKTVSAAAYAALSLFAVRGMPEVIYPLLKATGDVTFINAFANCFGKQAYSDFMERAKTATFEPAMRFVEGYDPNRVPPEDAFTVMDLLNTLQADDQARILMDHPSFQYSRVSRGRVDADENLSSAEQEKLDEIQTKMKGEKSAKKLKELQDELNVLLAAKKDALKFVADDAPDGYEINGLVFNETRPNVSFRVRKTGTVDLGERMVKAGVDLSKVSSTFKTFIFRNYTIVKDGLVNIEKLPVTVSSATLAKLKQAGVKIDHDTRSPVCFVIDVKPLPIINRKMVKSVTAKELIELEYELLKTQAAQKVYNHVVKEKWPDAKLAGWAKDYGDAAAEWLKEQGLTEYSGFNPKMVQAPVKDFYMGKELEVKLKGMSSLPSVNEVLKNITAGKKLNACSEMMQKHMVDAETFLGSKAKDDPNAKKWALGKKGVYTAETRALLYKTAQLKTSILVGQIWPKDLGSMDNTTMTVKIDGKDIVGTLAMREIQIEI